ncbi:MAG: ribosome small subunit-dependent GTPase A [Bacteroidetes bacterium]|nr:ribosome small subunit-dependent GTPase A [Bacteroidota bacterium]
MIARVLKSTGHWYEVQTEEGEYFKCRIRGKLRTKGIQTTNPVAAGDFVEIIWDDKTEEGIATIQDILPRKNYIIRKSVNLSKEAQIVAANIDIAFLVITLSRPSTTTGFVDRFLVTAEAYDIPVILLFHKVDQYDAQELEELARWERLYQDAGYSTMRSSLESGVGMQELKKAMENQVVLFSGHSGVGKSSLIQYFVPDRDIRVGDISDWSEKGQHTTTFAEVFATVQGGWIIDTPGIKGFGLVDIPKEEIGLYFKEMFGLLPNCKFNTCQHIEEPGCAVRKGVEQGTVAASRYHNYRSMLEDDKGKSPYR